MYVTLDIDVVDPAFAPGTGTPQVGGLSSAQILDLVRCLKGLKLVGCDLVEVSPPYDNGEITSLLAANLLFRIAVLVLGQHPIQSRRRFIRKHSLMITLARKLRVVDYFTLGWGTMVGVGWLVVMDDWLLRGGAWALFWIRNRRRAAASDRLRLRPAGHGHARRRRRGRLHREGLSPIHQLRHRMDDGARLLHRLSVGSRRRRKNCSLHFPSARFDGALSHRRTAGVFAPPDHRAGAYRASDLLNYRGVRLSATFQNWTTFGTLALFVVFVGGGSQQGFAAAISRPCSRTAGLSRFCW